MKVVFYVSASFVTREGMIPAKVEAQCIVDNDPVTYTDLIAGREHARTLLDDACHDFLQTITVEKPDSIETTEGEP